MNAKWMCKGQVASSRKALTLLALCFQYLHDLSIAHRDIKPRNLLLSPASGLVQICDLGSACHVHTGAPLTSYICSRYFTMKCYYYCIIYFCDEENWRRMINCLRSLIGWINLDRDLTEMKEPYLKLHLASLITQTFKLLDLLLFYNSKKSDTNYQRNTNSELFVVQQSSRIGKTDF